MYFDGLHHATLVSYRKRLSTPNWRAAGELDNSTVLRPAKFGRSFLDGLYNSSDASYKVLFSVPELVLGFIPDEWLHSFDYSTLEKMPGSYVTDDLRHRADDVVWRVKVGPEWVYLYILIEFQSKVDPWMAVRMMSYVGLLYQDLIKAKQVLPHRELPPVLPIVLYNGDAPWTAATNIATLIPKVPGLVAQFLPRMEYLLVAENHYTEDDLAKMQNLAAAMMRLQRPHDQSAVLEVIDHLSDWLADNPELMRIFAIWIRTVLLRQSKNELTLPKVQDLKELKMTLAARFEEWANQSKQEGRQEGEARILQRLLVARFRRKPLPPSRVPVRCN